MINAQKIMPVTKVKRELLDIFKAMQEDGTTITVTRNGEAVGVIMTQDRYESILETIEILADRKLMAALESSSEDFKSGRVYSDDEVWGK